jgi:hypothetical protein
MRMLQEVPMFTRTDIDGIELSIPPVLSVLGGHQVGREW